MKNLFFLLLFVVSISGCDGQVNNIKKVVSQSNTIKSKENILAELDRIFNRLNLIDSASMSLQSPDYMFFLDLEHGDVVTAGSKMHLFGDKNNWAIVFEKIGYSEAGGEVQSELNFIGNCINYKKENNGQRDVLNNTAYITLIAGQELEKIQMPEQESEDYFEMINPETKKVKIRNKQIKIELDKTTYAKYKIKLVDSNNPKGFVSFGNLARFLYATQPKSFCANPYEIRSMLPKTLPFIMTIDKFHFKSSYDPKNLPSSQELYSQIADVLMSLDKTLWKPKEQPNNEWYNWESVAF